MPTLNWSEEYSINVAEIDEQHKELLERVNAIHKAVKAQIDVEELLQLLSGLLDYTRFHFETEERLMDEHGLSAKNHREEHQVLLTHLSDLVASASQGRYPVFYADYDVSDDWFLAHILQSDKKLGEHLNKKSVY